MFQSIRVFKTRYVLTMVYISKSKETLTLLPNIRIILFSNKIQLLPYLITITTACNYFVKIQTTNAKQQNFIFYILRPFSKNMGNMRSSLTNQIADIFTC